jgi:hypothetical protein
MISGLRCRGFSTSIESVAPVSAHVVVALGGGITADGEPQPATVARSRRAAALYRSGGAADRDVGCVRHVRSAPAARGGHGHDRDRHGSGRAPGSITAETRPRDTIGNTVLEHGTAEILDVPGDQQAALRRMVRAEVKKRMGYGLKIYAHESVVIFVCDPIYDLHADEHMRRGPKQWTHFSAVRPRPTSQPRACGGAHGPLNKDHREDTGHGTPLIQSGREHPGCQAASGGCHQGMSFRLLIQGLGR